MGAVAEIVLTMDDSGVVTALQRTEGGLKKLGSDGNVILTGIEGKTTKTSAALRMMAGSVGLGNVQFLSMARLGVPGILAAIALAAGAAALKFESIAQAARSAGDNIQLYADRLRQFLGLGESAALQYEALARQQKLLLPLLDKEAELRREAATAGLEGGAAIRASVEQQIEEINRLANEQKVKALEEISDSRKKQEAMTAIERSAEAARQAAREGGSRQRVALAQKVGDEIRKAEMQTALIGLSELDTIEERARLLKQEIDLRRDITSEAKELLKGDVDRAAARQKTQLEQKVEVQGILARLQAEAEASEGIERIRREEAAEIARIEEQERQTGIRHAGEREALEIRTAQRIAELRRQTSEETLRMEEQAALASLPPWQRANAGIITSAEQRQREVEEALRRTEITEEEAARRTAAIWQEANAQIRDVLVGTLEEFASGPMEFFKRRWKQMLLQMIADTILSSNTLRQIFGSIFGIPLGQGGGGSGGGFGIPGSGPGGTPPFNPNPFSFLSGFSGGGFGGFGFGESFSSGFAPLSGTGISGGRSGQPGQTQPGIAGLMGGLANIREQLGLPPLSRTGQILSGAALFAGSLLFGNPNSRGLSALGGALAGGSIGFQIGGPIGLAIGAGIGLIVGLFMGGGNAAKRDKLVRDLQRQVDQVVQAYEFHQLDYLGAIGQLESMRQQAVEQLRQLGGDGHRARDIVDRAIRRIDELEAERQRRLALQFNPPQFHQGGVVGPQHAAASNVLAFPSARSVPLRAVPSFHDGGDVLARLKLGEGVLTPRGMRAVGGAAGLAAINAGGGGGGIVVNINPQRLDREWLYSTGGEEIARAVLHAQRRGAA